MGFSPERITFMTMGRLQTIDQKIFKFIVAHCHVDRVNL